MGCTHGWDPATSVGCTHGWDPATANAVLYGFLSSRGFVHAFGVHFTHG